MIRYLGAPHVQAALDELGGAGVVEITDSGRYAENLTLTATAGAGIAAARR